MYKTLEENKFNKFALITVVLSLAIRTILPFYFSSSWLTTDSKNYILQSEDLLNGTFGLYFPNGYPAIIALITLIFGNEHRDLCLIILNIILSTASVILFWFVIKKYFGASLFSFIALVLFAFYPNQLNYLRFILTEIPALFFLLLSFYFLSKRDKLIAALSIGIAVTIKTVLLPAILLFVIYLFYKRRFANGIIFIVVALIPILIMMIYGLIITGKFTLGYSSIHNFYLTVYQPGLQSTNILDAISYYLNYAISHPFKFVIDRFNSLWEFWGFLPSANEGLRENLFVRLLVGIRFPLLLLASYGFIKTKEDKVVVFSVIVIIIGNITAHCVLFYSAI